MDIQERLQVFFHRLEAAPAADSAEKAMALVCRLIEAVEDEFCPLPRKSPPPLDFTGRMYAPQSDRTRRLPGGQWVANTRGHRIYCQPDGAILIENTPGGRTVFSKPGRKK